jgi:phosphodiesterase/alkaline phosphatase D-like protein
VKRTLSAGMVLALLATLVTFASVRANVVCTVSVALTISDVSATKIGHNHATICWSTDGKATSQVFYDTVSHNSIADYSCYTREQKALVKKHKVTLNKLSPSTTYYYRVRSTAGGAEFVSDEYSFTTLPLPGRWRGWWANLFPKRAFPLYLCWLW